MMEFSEEQNQPEIYYGVSFVAKQSNLGRPMVEKLLRRGLVRPYVQIERGRVVRKFDDAHLEAFKSAQVLLDVGLDINFVVSLARPLTEEEQSKQSFLSEEEKQVLRHHFIDVLPTDLSPEENADSIEKNAVRKIVRRTLINLEFSRRPLSYPEAVAFAARKKVQKARDNREHILTQNLSKEIRERIQTEISGAKIHVSESVGEVTPVCTHCQKPGVYVCNQGAYTRVWGVYQCPENHLFTSG